MTFGDVILFALGNGMVLFGVTGLIKLIRRVNDRYK